MTDQVFTQKQNAKRAAEKMIGAGAAPSLDYSIRKREDGAFEIVWEPMIEEQEGYTESDDAPAFDVWSEAEDAADAAIAQLDQRLAEMDEHADEPSNPWPDGTRVQIGKRASRLGTIAYRVGGDHWRVQMDNAPKGSTVLYHCKHFLQRNDAAPADEAKPAKQERAQRVGRKHEKTADLDAAVARGTMPPKPIMTSKANPHYQKRFDFLAQKAAEGDWDAVRKYEVKGINSYAKMVKQYRDRLLAAHAAQQSSKEAA